MVGPGKARRPLAPKPAKVLQRPRSSGAAPSIGAVAERAGVSVATVSRVINGIANKAAPPTIERVHQAIAELNYRPMPAGRTLRTGQTRLVALIVPDASNGFYGSVAASVEQVLREQAHTMLLCNTNEDPERQDDYLIEMRAHMVRAIVLLGAVRSPILERFVADGEPIVFVIRECPVAGTGPYIGIDNYAAGRDIADHFAEKGYGPCGVIHGPLSSSASRGRFEGFRDRMAELCRPLSPAEIRCGDLSFEAGYARAAALLGGRQPMRAIFCGNDVMAYGAYRYCTERGLAVPDDVALFGFDDNPLNKWLAPWLSTVKVPQQDFGPAVGNILQRLWSDDGFDSPPRVILPYELVLRTSA
jgi:LacI family transcriptional regulator